MTDDGILLCLGRRTRGKGAAPHHHRAIHGDNPTVVINAENTCAICGNGHADCCRFGAAAHDREVAGVGINGGEQSLDAIHMTDDGVLFGRGGGSCGQGRAGDIHIQPVGGISCGSHERITCAFEHQGGAGDGGVGRPLFVLHPRGGAGHDVDRQGFGLTHRPQGISGILPHDGSTGNGRVSIPLKVLRTR